MAEKVMVFNILKSLKNHVRMILGITFLSMLIIWIMLTYVFTPQYQATSQLYIEDLAPVYPEAGQAENSVGFQAVEAYMAMITSNEVLSAAIEETGISLTPTELFEKVTVSNVAASQVLNITVEGKDKKLAGEIANSLASAAVSEGWKLMEVDKLSIIAKASVEEVPSVLGENVKYIVAIGGIFGTIVGILMAFIVELFTLLFRTGVLEQRRKHSSLQTVFK